MVWPFLLDPERFELILEFGMFVFTVAIGVGIGVGMATFAFVLSVLLGVSDAGPHIGATVVLIKY